MKMLVHVCCASDLIATYYHLKSHDLTFFFFNPNIHPPKEYEKRLKAVEFLAEKWKLFLIEGNYDVKKWYETIKEYKELGEGSKRCYECIKYRLEETAKFGRKKFDVFTTTLTASPKKNLSWIERIGKTLEQKYSIKFYFFDFKKKGGQEFSVEISKKFDIYRQNYCGCIFSKIETEKKRKISQLERKRILKNILSSYNLQRKIELDPEIFEIDEELFKFGEKFLEDLLYVVRPRKVLLPENLWADRKNLKIKKYKVKIIRRNNND